MTDVVSDDIFSKKANEKNQKHHLSLTCLGKKAFQVHSRPAYGDLCHETQ